MFHRIYCLYENKIHIFLIEVDTADLHNNSYCFIYIFYIRGWGVGFRTFEKPGHVLSGSYYFMLNHKKIN